MPRPEPKPRVETTRESLAVLASYRLKGVRNSLDVVERGEKVLKEKGALRRMGDEVWPFLEQLGFAGLDTGRTDLASICVQRLEEKFPNSPRVDALYGLLQELESPEKAREFYEGKLQEDENNIPVRKRLIALHLSLGDEENGDASLSIRKGVELLVEHLDTVYNDPEGWSMLVDVYEKLGMLRQALSCLSDLILLQPTNPFHQLRYAETAYTLGEYSLAYRTFCRVLEMSGKMSEGGLGRRAGFGIKLCLQRLEKQKEAESSTEVVTSSQRRKQAKRGAAEEDAASGSVAKEVAGPQWPNKMDELVTEELLFAYHIAWYAPGDRVAGHAENKVLKQWLEGQAAESDSTVVR